MWQGQGLKACSATPSHSAAAVMEEDCKVRRGPGTGDRNGAKALRELP